MDESYISRMEINVRRRAAGRFLASPQVMHAAVEAAFPADTVGMRRLWRIDRIGEGTYLYLVSSTKPDLTHLVEQIGRPSLKGWDTKHYSSFLSRLSVGQTWAFRLTANPTHSGRKTPGGETQRFGHLTVQQQTDWLAKRLPQWGLRALTVESEGSDRVNTSLNVVDRELVRFGHRKGSAMSSDIVLNRTSFEGIVRVADEEILRRSLVSGMGHAKAYGCGLMTLARP